ncbi:MAG: class I SAM-dependent methyltransferase [Campylobacterota bacterium]|nr:class I SAM-dependent methyltransferase [Campylobacterota bacterium]
MSQSDNYFENVYKNADKDNLVSIPWANLAANSHLVDYLNVKDDMTYGRALVIGCGLGDDADALAKMGYEVDAIDISHTAIEIAKERFFDTEIDFRVEDIFQLPQWMFGMYDFVFESRTIQSLAPKLRDELIKIIANLVSSGGELLLHTNLQDNNTNYGGPPWPLYKDELLVFESHGLVLKHQSIKKIYRPIAAYDAVLHYKK